GQRDAAARNLVTHHRCLVTQWPQAENPGGESLEVAFGETASGASNPDSRAARLAPVRSAPDRSGKSGWRTLTASDAGWLGDWPCGRRGGRSSAGDRPSAAQG